MGRSGSSSQANQATSTSSSDNRIVNESGIVARDSALDLSNYYSDSSTMSLSNYDARDMSTNNSFSDSSNRSTNVFSNDSSDRSISNLFTDSRSTSNSFTDSGDRSTKSWDSSSSNAVTGSYNTSADPLITKQAFDFATNNDAMLGAGLDRMLGFASELTGKSTDSATTLAARFQDGMSQAYDSGRNTTPGGIDNKTMIVLGIAGAAALAFMVKKGS